MIGYKLISYQGKDVSIQKLVEGVFVLAIPFDEGNTDYQEYLKWVEAGNTPEPADE